MDYITGTGGGIIGAEIRYQKPFDGADVDVSVDNTDIVLSADKPGAKVKILNKSFVPFEIEQEGASFTVNPIYDKDIPFIITGIDISCPDNTAAAKELKGSVILTTESGKQTEIKVTQIAADPYISPAQTELEFDAQGLVSKYFDFDSNVADEVEVSTTEEWIKVEETNGDMWNLKSVCVVTSTNCSTDTRTGYVTLKYGNITKRVKIEQTGFDAIPQLPEVYDIEAKAYTGYNPIEIPFYSTPQTGILMDNSMFSVKSNESWIYNLSVNWRYAGYYPYVYLNISDNFSDSPRQGDVNVYYNQKGFFDDILFATITIRQDSKQ